MTAAGASNVHVTDALIKALEAESPGLAADLTKSFQTWKQGDEFQHYLFGKDAAYAKPDIDGVPYQLRHVHLAPLSDPAQLKLWNTKWKTRSRKTSDRALVYAERRSGGSTHYLMIYILPEPDAHEIARMQTREHSDLMDGFANTAAAFIDDGSIIA